MSFQRIHSAQLKELRQQGKVTLLDIRDAHSFRSGRIDDALHIEEIEIDSFVETYPDTTPLVIYCYHGYSSLSAAAWFVEKGIADVYSLDGGYDGWQHLQNQAL